MIFVTIGTQAPFDRFIEMMDEIAGGMKEEIVAQTCHGTYEPKHLKTIDFVPPDEFEQLFTKARLIVAHAGMGTILSALSRNKPIIVFPRIAALGEHRNEHQLATAKKMKELGLVYVASNREELEQLIKTESLESLAKIGETASESLTESLRREIRNTP
ncbi:MAG: glycosyl transferase family 28 [Paludibacteraceae bacterium]|jgi:UDP-N-acetylglucosamine transferase subunit ALG13|nr:glycosyl transferase family 28 [Paludibacteraceae bacterium]MCR5297853.1 glycosyl transferase family 28 [Paludibacteraceae bacterium]